MPLGLVYRETEDGEFIVAVPDPSSPLFSRVSERMEYRPMHVSPDELLKLLPAREARFLTVVDKRNLMIIEAPKEIADPILERLQQVDNPIPQVELEAIVCVIAPDRGFKSGLDWNHAVTLNGSEVFKLGMAGLAFNGQGSGEGSRSAFSNFAVTAAFVKLLAQEGYLSIRAAPRVTARDGEPAKIAITRQSFFSTQPTSSNAFFRQELEEVEAGITMEITPVIRGDNITVKIEKAEVSEDIRTTDVNAAVANNPFPLINRRTVSTTVSVRDAETIVIGGLVQRQTVDRISKVPVLGDIPYAGRLFQTVEQLEQDAEVVIFISPRIVTGGPSCTPGVEEVLVEEVPPTE
jgi:type II secretory pathway component GspD/PulD (secretin)